MIARGWGENREGLISDAGFPFLDEELLELERRDGCQGAVRVHNATELHTFK